MKKVFIIQGFRGAPNGGWKPWLMVELEKQIDRAVQGFCKIEGVSEDLANQLVGEGYLSYGDLSVIEPEDLMRIGALTEEQVDAIVSQADALSEKAEQRAQEEKQQRKAERKEEKEKEKDKGDS